MELEGALEGACLAEVLLSQLLVGWELEKSCRAGGAGDPREPGDICWSFALDMCEGGRPTPLIPY